MIAGVQGINLNQSLTEAFTVSSEAGEWYVLTMDFPDSVYQNQRSLFPIF